MKQWLLLRRFPAEGTLEEGFAAAAVKDLELLLPFVRFLNAGLAGNEQTPFLNKELRPTTPH
jgi:hypothetical protein